VLLSGDCFTDMIQLSAVAGTVVVDVLTTSKADLVAVSVEFWFMYIGFCVIILSHTCTFLSLMSPFRMRFSNKNMMCIYNFPYMCIILLNLISLTVFWHKW